ncbi:hypothetical protein [Ammoniphilus sp. YIM 78166]|uniref:hypothetical protein n=1 Tax=Ammoniphilus sp. YIM 78166 TaxID=1644106 RepID=UPI001431394A|nr:hypothetical protein [Ammoniphilus sp. YIM 78166]
MPDIQAGDVEITQEEAKRLNQLNQAIASDDVAGIMRVDELGEAHDESAYTHLGRS